MYPWYFYLPYWELTRDRQKRLRLSLLSIFIIHFRIASSSHTDPSLQHYIYTQLKAGGFTLTFGAKAEDGEVDLKHSVCVGKPKIDGAKECGPCSYEGRGDKRGLEAAKSWNFGTERMYAWVQEPSQKPRRRFLVFILLSYFPSIWKKDNVCRRRAQRCYSCDRGGNKKKLGAEDLQSNFGVGTWSPESSWIGTSWVSQPCWPTVGTQKMPVIVWLSWQQWRQQRPSNGCIGSTDESDGWLY